MGVVLAVLLVIPLARVTARAQTPEPQGAQLYGSECAYCHGATAAGDAPDAGLFVHPPPALDAAARADPEALIRRILDGSSGSLALDAAAVRRRADRGEALVSYLGRLPTIDWPLAEHGRSLYLARCQRCHGPLGRPGSGTSTAARRPRAFSDPAFQAGIDDETLRTAVRHARAGMPSLLQDVNDADARALAAYIRLLSPGYETYERLCVGCHGAEGMGAGSSGTPRLPRVRFDREYIATHDAASLRRNVWHMLDDERPVMAHFRGALTETEVRAIVGFLQSTASKP